MAHRLIPEAPHRHQLAVRRQAADRDEDREQEGHRDRQDDDVRQAVGQELQGDRRLHVAADDHLRVLEELLHEGQEREHQEPENERSRRLAEDVAVEESVHRGFSHHSDSSGGWPATLLEFT